MTPDVSLERVKMLCLRRGPPQTFSVVDAVLRDIAVSRVVASRPLDADPASAPPDAPRDVPETRPEEVDRVVPKAPAAEGTIPFSASVSYSCLEDDVDLIHAFIDTLLGRTHTHVQHTPDLPPAVAQQQQQLPDPPFARKKSLEVKQAAQLDEFQEWRKQLMATVPVHAAATHAGDDTFDDILLESLESVRVQPRRPVGGGGGGGTLRAKPRR